MKRSRWMAFGTVALVLFAGLVFRSTIMDVYWLLTNRAPNYAQAVPARSILVVRANIAKLALKGDLSSLSGYPQIRALKEKVSRLYPRMDELQSDPLGETGIQLTGNQYLFAVPEPEGGLGIGILFGIRNQEKAVRFLSRLAEDAQPEQRRSYQMLSLSGTAAFAWNKNFGMFFAAPGATGQNLTTELDDLMNPSPENSFESRQENREWIESEHDLTGYCSGALLESSVRHTLEPYGLSSVDSMKFRFSVDFGEGRLKSTLTMAGPGGMSVEERFQNRKLLTAMFGDSSLLVTAFHLPLENVKTVVRKNYTGFYSRQNAVNISAQDLFDAVSGDLVLEVADVKPGRDLRGKVWPFPQFALAVGLKNAAAIRKGSQYLLEHHIAKNVSGHQEIHFGEYELYYIVQNDFVFLTNRRNVIERPWKSTDASAPGVSSRFSLRVSKLLSILAPYVGDRRTKDMMEIAGNTMDGIAVTAVRHGAIKELQMELIMKSKEKNSLQGLTEIMLQLSERYFR